MESTLHKEILTTIFKKGGSSKKKKAKSVGSLATDTQKSSVSSAKKQIELPPEEAKDSPESEDKKLPKKTPKAFGFLA